MSSFAVLTLIVLVDFSPTQAMRLISELVISHFLGYLGYLIFEAPCLSITKALFLPKKSAASDVNDNIRGKKAN